MFRKISAVAFLLVMAMFITLKLPVLGYCLCLDTYITSGCSCQSAAEVKEKPSSQCCGNCAEDSAQDSFNPDQTVTESSLPCDDCVKQLIVDVGSFQWHGSDSIPPELENFQITHPSSNAQIVSNFGFRHSPTAIRGDPPPSIAPASVPIYLRHAALRL